MDVLEDLKFKEFLFISCKCTFIEITRSLLVCRFIRYLGPSSRWWQYHVISFKLKLVFQFYDVIYWGVRSIIQNLLKRLAFVEPCHIKNGVAECILVPRMQNIWILHVVKIQLICMFKQNVYEDVESSWIVAKWAAMLNGTFPEICCYNAWVCNICLGITH